MRLLTVTFFGVHYRLQDTFHYLVARIVLFFPLTEVALWSGGGWGR